MAYSLLHVLRQHEDPDLAATARGSRIAARKPSSVKSGGMRTSTTARSGRLALDRVDQLLAVTHRRDHLLAGVEEEPGEAGAEQHGVLGDHDPHGISTSNVVGPPCGLITCIVPPTDGDPVAEPGEPRAVPLGRRRPCRRRGSRRSAGRRRVPIATHARVSRGRAGRRW